MTLAYEEILGEIEIGAVPFTGEVPAGYDLDKDRVREYRERDNRIRTPPTERAQQTGPFVALPTSIAAPPT